MTGRHHRGKKYVNPNDEPLNPEPLTTAGPQPWHAEALRLRAAGWLVREIAQKLGKGKSAVQRFLNPDSKAKAKARQNERDKERRYGEPEYLERTNSYRRRYMQYRAPERWKKD